MEILIVIGTILGAAIASFITIWRMVPRKMNNDLSHIRKDISHIKEEYARLDERTKGVEDDVRCLFDRINTHIDGHIKGG